MRQRRRRGVSGPYFRRLWRLQRKTMKGGTRRRMWWSVRGGHPRELSGRFGDVNDRRRSSLLAHAFVFQAFRGSRAGLTPRHARAPFLYLIHYARKNTLDCRSEHRILEICSLLNIAAWNPVCMATALHAGAYRSPPWSCKWGCVIYSYISNCY